MKPSTLSAKKASKKKEEKKISKREEEILDLKKRMEKIAPSKVLLPHPPEVISYGIVACNRTEYDPDFHPLDFIAHCREGNSATTIAAFWGCSRTTIDNWQKRHKDFAKAFSIGKTAYQAFWSDISKKSALGHMSATKLGFFCWHTKNHLAWSDDGGDDFGVTSDDSLVFETEEGMMDIHGKMITPDQSGTDAES